MDNLPLLILGDVVIFRIHLHMCGISFQPETHKEINLIQAKTKMDVVIIGNNLRGTFWKVVIFETREKEFIILV